AGYSTTTMSPWLRRLPSALYTWTSTELATPGISRGSPARGKARRTTSGRGSVSGLEPRAAPGTSLPLTLTITRPIPPPRPGRAAGGGDGEGAVGVGGRWGDDMDGRVEADRGEGCDGAQGLLGEAQVLGQQAGIVVALLELVELDRLQADDPVEAGDAAAVG